VKELQRVSLDTILPVNFC